MFDCGEYVLTLNVRRIVGELEGHDAIRPAAEYIASTQAPITELFDQLTRLVDLAKHDVAFGYGKPLDDLIPPVAIATLCDVACRCIIEEIGTSFELFRLIC